MKRVKRNFIFFFLVLIISFGFLFEFAYSNLKAEEERAVISEAQKVYNLIQSEISLFILREESFITTNINQNLPPWGLGYLNYANISSHTDSSIISSYFELLPNGKFSWSNSTVKKTQFEKVLLSIVGDSALKKDITFGRKDSIQENNELIQNQLSDIEGELDIENDLNSNRDESQDVMPDSEEGFMDSFFRSKSPQKSKKEYYPDPIEEKRKEKKIDKNYYQKKSSSNSIIDRVEGLFVPTAHATQSRLNQNIVDVVSDFPFKVQLVDEDYLVFYRYSPLKGSAYLQGFIVKLDNFFSSILDKAFVNSKLIDFSRVSIYFNKSPLFDYGISSISRNNLIPIYSQKLGYPLNRLSLKFEANRIPQITSRFYLDILLALISMIVTFGLWIIYKNVSSQILLSEKRQDFVSSVTHELRTPLTTIQLYSDMLNKDMVPSEDKKKNYYHYLSQESSRLSRLVENVLQLARLEKKTLKLNLKEDSLVNDIQLIENDLSAFVEDHHFKIISQFDHSQNIISYDAEVLKQVLVTLIENSIKFGKENVDKRILIHIHQDSLNLVLSLSDFGPGIPKSQHKKVFEKFYRVESELTRKTKGTGIGLAMVKMLVEAMNGRIELENNEPNGVKFRIIFPIINYAKN